MINPSKQGEFLNSPTERASKINDPQFENNSGYFAFDLTHAEYITPRFGEVTPSCHIDVVSGDRIIVSDDTKLIRNQINGNLLSTINQYQDSFFVSLRNVFPNNYEKLLPNPVHGDDLPNSALPQVPLLGMLNDYLFGTNPYFITDDGDALFEIDMNRLTEDLLSGAHLADQLPEVIKVLVGRMSLVLTVISRGQLLDYLGYNLDIGATDEAVCNLQYLIDQWFDKLYANTNRIAEEQSEYVLNCITLDLNKDGIDYTSITSARPRSWSNIFEWRSILADCFEAGQFPWFNIVDDAIDNEFDDATHHILEALKELLSPAAVTNDVDIYDYLDEFDQLAEPFADGYTMNIGKILGYQQIIAQYYSNDHIDNVFSSDLYMENLRSVMYPCDFSKSNNITREPVFQYNGRAVEYDYISYGGFWTSLISDTFDGTANRQHVWMTLMLLMRRSLRYGDYFSTARPNMLAVSDQLGINVENGMVSPIDVTKNLLLQRYLNASNYIGQGFLQYMASMFGVKPSDSGCVPRFISHKKITVGNQVTNNTADNQGYQTTNLVAHGEKQAMDVYCDDFGYLYTLCSFDTLPVYDRGVDPCYHFADRFDYFNPMMQNIGDQPIRLSEITGNPDVYGDTFGYTMRNAEYKYKISKTHGAFVNELRGFLIHYPLSAYVGEDGMINIDPDFIRDKPIYLDRVLDSSTGTSPANYFHFVISCVNEVKAARKITATPSILF